MSTPHPSNDPEVRLLCFIHWVAGNHARGLGVSQTMQEDLAQEAVAECLARMRNGAWREYGDLRSFVRRFVRSRCIDRSRRRRRDRNKGFEFSRELTEVRHAWMSPDLAMEEREMDALHARTLDQLPRKCRVVFEMVREERTTYQMVAERMGITIGTVKWHVVTAQRHFRTALHVGGFANPTPRNGHIRGDAA